MRSLSLTSGISSILIILASINLHVRAAINPELNNVPNRAHKNLATAKSLEQAVHNQINEYRQKQNFPPLAFDETIAEQARLHSVAMANAGRISHNGFDNRAAVLGRSIQYSGVAENVASNQGFRDPGLIAVKSWIASPTHHRTMVGKFDLTGIGVVEKGGSYYFTQIFVLKR
jgi:uncharacterized protein YkwD